MSGKNTFKVTPKKKLPSSKTPPNRSAPNRQPPSRAQPAGPKGSKAKKGGNQNKGGGGGDNQVVARLQELVQERNAKIEQLTQKVNDLTMQNKTLQRKIDNLQKAGPPKKKKSVVASSGGGGGVDTGMSQKGAANALAGLLGGHVKNKKLAEDKANAKPDAGGVSTGMSQAGAKNALAGLFGAKKGPPKKASGGGVESGPSQKNAAAALGGLFAAKKSPPKAAKKSGGGGNADQYKQLFKKYEMMMKLGINVHGAVGRMRQDGVDKAAIAAFEKKHNAYGDEEEEDVDPVSLGLKPKKEVQVGKGIKMKRLHWDSVNIKTVKGSLWEDLDESTIRYDKKHFELHFQVRQRKPIDEEKKSQMQAKAGEIITFVSKKRTQGVLIGLKNLNLDNDQLRRVLHNMDEKIMTVDTLAKLLEMAPTMDEQTEAEKKIMQEGTRNVKNYGIVEQFFYALCDFYNLHQRLKLWMFKQNFAEICDSLLDQYKTVGKACDRVRTNKNLRILLTILLAFGNHMNAGTRKGQTYGFDLKILTQMTGVKSFDNTRSLLMYIYEFCDRKYPNALRVIPELMDTIKAASSMEIETLKQAYQRIQDNMQEIKNLITSDEIENYDIDDRFITVLDDFYKKAAPKMKKFNMTVGNVMVSTKRVMKKFSYGTEESPQTIESFFKIWWKFFQDLSGSKEKLIKLEKERQKRIAKRKKMKDKEKKKQMHEKYGNKALPGSNNNNNGDGDGPELAKGSSLYREFEKRQKFDQKKGKLHGKLRGHVKQRSIFIQNGGKLDGNQPQNNTMRRLSSMYQDQQDQVKAMEDARKKAAILKYNKFRLPDINKQNKRKWTATSFADTGFQIPDDKPMMAPVGNATRNKKPNQIGTGTPPANNGHGINHNGFQKNKNGASSPIGKKPLTIKPKQKQKQPINNQYNNGVPPPPSNGVPPPPSNNGGYPMYGQNPQNNWAQQAQLGYGSNPNLSYQNAYNQQPMNQYQQQQRQQYGQQNKHYYNNPYKK